MYCPRLEHFVRLNHDGTIGKCGHMVKTKGFKTFRDLHKSQWLKKIELDMIFDEWPDECIRCKQTEDITGDVNATSTKAENLITTMFNLYFFYIERDLMMRHCTFSFVYIL